MTDQPDNTMTTEEETAVATQVGIEAIRRIHAIEREMLSRAIQALVASTGKTALEVTTILSEGLDEGYTEAMKSAYASAEVIQSGSSGLIIP
jgi:hypothetical protein